MVRKVIKAGLWAVINLFCFICIFICIFLYNNDRKVLVKDNGYIYVSLQHESNPLNTDINQMTAFVNSLKSNKFFTYYEIYGQPLYYYGTFLTESINAEKLQDEIQDLTSLQIDSGIFEDFNILVQDGRDFYSADYLLSKSGKIPVIIGSDLSDRLSVGDCFTAEYLYDTYTFEVIGILQPDAMIYMTNRIYPLNGTIILPSFDINESTVVTDGIKIHYANKASGILRFLEKDKKHALKALEECINATRSGEYSWYATTYDINLKKLLHLGISEIIIICIIIIIAVNIPIILKRKRT